MFQQFQPKGLGFDPAFLTGDEERALLVEVEQLDFREIVLHGVAARRTACHFGLDYDYEHRVHLEQAEPLPPWLEPLRARCAALAGLEPEVLVEALVQHYPAGATMGWHRDAPSFGVVVGVSLGSSARLRFRRGSTGRWTTWELDLPPRSAYVLAGESRSTWQHSIPPTKALRYSITFRTLRASRRRPAAADAAWGAAETSQESSCQAATALATGKATLSEYVWPV